VSKRSEVVYINGAPSTPDYLLALLRELSHVPRGLTEIAEAKQVQKTNKRGILYQFKKKVRKCILTFEPKISLISFARGSGPPLSTIRNLEPLVFHLTGRCARTCTPQKGFFTETVREKGSVAQHRDPAAVRFGLLSQDI